MDFLGINQIYKQNIIQNKKTTAEEQKINKSADTTSFAGNIATLEQLAKNNLCIINKHDKNISFGGNETGLSENANNNGKGAIHNKNFSISSESCSDLAKEIKSDIHKLELLKREAEYEQLPKTPIPAGNNKFYNIADLSEDPKFRIVISKIKNVKSSGKERVQEITDLLLEYMGYPKGIITPQICKQDGTTVASYSPDIIELEISTDKAFKQTNLNLGKIIFHELTHMDNHMKVVKTLGIEQYLEIVDINIKNMITENLKDPQFKESIISYFKDNISDFPSQVTDEQLYSIVYNEYLKEQSEKLNEFTKYTKMTDTEIISAIKDEYLNHSYKNGQNITLLEYATNKYQYRHSPDEALAYARAEQFAYVAGIESNAENHWKQRTITEKAKQLAEYKAKKLFGHGNLENLTEEQIKILDTALNKDVVEYEDMQIILEECYKRGIFLPLKYEDYKSMLKSGDNIVEDYILYKIKDGPYGLITSQILRIKL